MLPSSVGVMVHTFQETFPQKGLPSSQDTYTDPDVNMNLGIVATTVFIAQLPNISGDLCNVDLCVPITSLKL